jgi:hypothetical protein
VTLYRGEFLQHLAVRDSAAFHEWVTLWRERLHRAALEALAQLASYHEGCGEDEQARQYAWRTLGLEPWDEAAHRCVMRVLSRKGERSAALVQYARCRQVLAEELGVEPSDETVALYEQIRAGPVSRSVGSALPQPSTADVDTGRTSVPDTTSANAGPPPHRSTPTNLPAPPTPLIGREQELGRLRVLLQRPAARLVTLTGVGGSGKTAWPLRWRQNYSMPLLMASGSWTYRRSTIPHWSSRRSCRHSG